MCYAAYLKCCNYVEKNSVAGTYCTHLISLQSCIIQKSLHNIWLNFIIDTVIKRTAFYCIVRHSYIFRDIRLVFSSKFAFIWIPYEYCVLCYAVYLKCCDYVGKSSIAGTYSTHLLSLWSRVIQKSLHYTGPNFIIDMVIKWTAFYCIVWHSYIFEQIRIVLSSKFSFIWISYEYFVLCYVVYHKCCNYIGKSSVADTYSIDILSLQSCVI